MHPDPYTKEIREEEFNHPLTELYTRDKFIQYEVKDLQEQVKLNEACIDRFVTRIAELEEELATPWYIKLWNRIPRFSISIRRTN